MAVFFPIANGGCCNCLEHTNIKLTFIYAMKAYGGLQLQPHSFRPLGLDGAKWSAMATILQESSHQYPLYRSLDGLQS